MSIARKNLTLGLATLALGAGAPLAAAADWTNFSPSADTRTIYVSSSTGNDSNSGLTQSAPKRTVAAGYALLRDGFPDWLLLKSGDTWNESFGAFNKGGRSTTEMMRVGSYGSGERPRLLTGANTGLEADIGSAGRGHLAITDLYFKADGYNGGNGSPFGISFLGPWTDVLVENCKVEGYYTNVPLQGYEGQNMTNIRVRRNVIVDAYTTGSGHAIGLIIGHCDGGMVEENVVDHNGWSETVPGAGPDIFRHNVYINPDNTYNMTTRANVVARGAASGLRTGGAICEYNLLLANPVSIVFSNDAQSYRYNVTLDSRDLDANNPRGIGVTMRSAPPSEFVGNVFAQRSVPGLYNIQAIDVGGGSTGISIRDNIVYKWSPPDNSQYGQALVFNDTVSGITLSNNKFQQPGGGRVIWDNATSAQYTISNNRYYSTNAMPFHKGSDMAFPQWAAATSDSGSAFNQPSFPDPNRSIATYMTSLGQTPTLDAFLAQARLQSKANWRQQYTAWAVNAYIRAGFGMTVPGGGNCNGDFNGDSAINVTDAVLFQNAYAANDMRADMNGDGRLNILDFVTMQNAIAVGCH